MVALISLLVNDMTCHPWRIIFLANLVGKIIQLSPQSAGSEDLTLAVSKLAIAVMTLSKEKSEETLISLQKQLCDYLVRSGMYNEALNAFQPAASVCKERWSSLVSDWVKVKKRANLAGVKTVASRWESYVRFVVQNRVWSLALFWMTLWLNSVDIMILAAMNTSLLVYYYYCM